MSACNEQHTNIQLRMIIHRPRTQTTGCATGEQVEDPKENRITRKPQKPRRVEDGVRVENGVLEEKEEQEEEEETEKIDETKPTRNTANVDVRMLFS